MPEQTPPHMDTQIIAEQTVVETPPVETAHETVQTQTPVTEPVEPEPQPIVQPPAPLPEPDYSPKTVAQRLKDDDLKALLKEKGYNDFLIEALEYGHRTNGDFAAYWEAKHIDWNDKSRMPDEKVIELKLRDQYAQYGMTDAQVQKLVQREMKNAYLLGDDFDTESEDVEAARLKMHMDAFEYRKLKAQQQAQFRAPEPQPQETPIAPEVVMEQARQGLLADPAVQGFYQQKAVKFGDYTHAIDNPDAVLQVLYNADAYNTLNYVRDAQGNVAMQNGQPVLNTGRLLKLATYASNMDAVEQKLIDYGKALGRKQLEDEAEVIPQREQGTPSVPGERTIIDALIEKMRGQ